MKHLLLTSLLAFLPLPVFGQYYGEVNSCRRLYDSYGYYIRTECNVPQQPYYYTPRPYYNNSQVYCDPSRTIIGGLLGTAIGGAASRGNGRYWAMPLGGAVGAATIGCRRY